MQQLWVDDWGITEYGEEWEVKLWQFMIFNFKYDNLWYLYSRTNCYVKLFSLLWSYLITFNTTLVRCSESFRGGECLRGFCTLLGSKPCQGWAARDGPILLVSMGALQARLWQLSQFFFIREARGGGAMTNP